MKVKGKARMAAEKVIGNQVEVWKLRGPEKHLKVHCVLCTAINISLLYYSIILYYAIISTVVSNSALYRLLSYYSWSSCLTKVTKLVNWLLFSGYYYIVQ